MQALSPDYCRRRLIQSQERVDRAASPAARAIHADLAHRYAELLLAFEPLPAVDTPADAPALRIAPRLA